MAQVYYTDIAPRPIPVMSPEEFYDVMKFQRDHRDPETFHRAADNLMCEILEALGYEEGVNTFRSAYKWYA